MADGVVPTAGSKWAQGVASIYAQCLKSPYWVFVVCTTVWYFGASSLCWTDCRASKEGRASFVTLLAVCTT